jgi:hypothetical protein
MAARGAQRVAEATEAGAAAAATATALARSGLALQAVGWGCCAMAVRWLVQPEAALRDMSTDEAWERHGRNNPLLRALAKWTGAFFLAFGIVTAWLGRQETAVSSELRTLHFLVGLAWLLDAVYVKFLSFAPSGVVRFWTDSLGAGLVDLAVGCTHLWRASRLPGA